MCILNIQGLPICRCPTVYYCKTRPRRKVCSSDNETFTSICLLKMKACTENRKISVAKQGACDDTASERRAERLRQREERLRQRQEKAKLRQEKLESRQQEKEQKQETKRQRRLEERQRGDRGDRPRDRAQPDARADRNHRANERRRGERRHPNGRQEAVNGEDRKSKRRFGKQLG